MESLKLRFSLYKCSGTFAWIVTSYTCIHVTLQGLTIFQISLVFTCLQYKSFENTVGKGETARNEQFLLFPYCFLSI